MIPSRKKTILNKNWKFSLSGKSKKTGEELKIDFDDELSKKAKMAMLKRLKTSY